jgi:hypothetical protein
MPRCDPIPVTKAIGLLQGIEAARLPTFLFGGTLLGAIREGRILPDDWDVDVAMLVEDWREAALARFRAAGLAIATVRRWGHETPWALGSHVPARWRGSPSLVKLVSGEHHVDLHVLAPGTDPAWRYWQRGPADSLMRTPAALLDGVAPVVIEGMDAAAPQHAAELLAYCFGDQWQTPVAAADWYTSPTFARIHAERTVAA